MPLMLKADCPRYISYNRFSGTLPLETPSANAHAPIGNPLTHKYDVTDGSYPRSVENLLKNLSGSEVTLQAHSSSGAKGTRHLTSHLRGDKPQRKYSNHASKPHDRGKALRSAPNLGSRLPRPSVRCEEQLGIPNPPLGKTEHFDEEPPSPYSFSSTKGHRKA